MTSHNGPPNAHLPVPEFSESELLALLRTDFRSFLRKCFYVLFGPDALIDNWHLDAIAWALMQVGPEGVLRQMILMPPRSMKSLIVSVFWVAWQLGRDPKLTIWVVSHSIDLAKDLHNKFRTLISHPDIQAVFPHLKSCLMIDNDSEVRTDAGGGRVAISVNGNVTGRGADQIIIDDALDAKHASNEAERQRLSAWVLGTLWTRMNQPARTPVVAVMQRLHLDDLVTHLQRVSAWNILQLPAVFSEATTIQLGEQEYHQADKGELLHPKHLPQSVLDERLSAMGKPAFSAQYLQAPIPDGGGMIDLTAFGQYDVLPSAYDSRIISVDSATGGDAGSFTVMIEAQEYQGRLYITDVFRKHIDIPDQVERIISRDEALNLDHIVVENAHAGMAVVQDLRKRYYYKEKFWSKHNFIEAVTPKGSKEVRMEAMLKYVRTGKVMLPASAPWLSAFRNELAEFPNGTHDDQVDALSQLLKFFEFYLRDPILREARGLSALGVL